MPKHPKSVGSHGAGAQESKDKPEDHGPSASQPDNPAIGEAPREYGHSSGDRNTRSRQTDWPEFDGGTQRNADPAGATDPAPDKS